MTLLVKDANTTVQALATESDGGGNLVPVHAPAVTAGGAAASDGSGTVAAGGSAQLLFGGAVPANGFLVQNNSASPLWVCDVGTASAGGASIQIAANGGLFATPSGYRPGGPVSLFGTATGQTFAARRW